MDFGDYCLIEQKRYGTDNEMYLHKVVRGQMRSNMYVPVPVQTPAKEEHGEMTEVIQCICCGVDETRVLKYRVEDCRLVGLD